MKIIVYALVLSPWNAAHAQLTVQTSITGPGLFEVLLDGNYSGRASNHLGIVSYGLQLEGPITSVDHKSPQTAFAQDSSLVGGPAGFTFLRSPDNNFLVGASQDTITPTPHLIYGFGLEAGSFAAQGLNPLDVPEQPVWGAPLLIASGTFDPSRGVPSVDVESIETFVNVFCLDGSIGKAALCIPEPSSSALTVLLAVSFLIDPGKRWF